MNVIPSVAAAALLVTLASSAEPYQGGSAALDTIVAPAAPRSPSMDDASNGPAVVTLLAFLGLIAGSLLRWSSDSSCRIARSVFATSEAPSQADRAAPARSSSISRRAGS